MQLPLDRSLTDDERFPLMTDAGHKMLLRLREHGHAPKFNHACGDRLTAEGLENVRQFERELHTNRHLAVGSALPPWVEAFAEMCQVEVPFYRERGSITSDFHSLPTCARADISREPWSFVPDSQPLHDLILYGTTGTTGHPLKILSHPEVSSKYLVLLKHALAAHGVQLEAGNGSLAIALVCAQNYTYTFASVSSYLDQAGFVKINLNPQEWRHASDREAFLNDLQPEIYSGDPLSFQELTKLKLNHKPKALVSSAMSLLPGWRKNLEDHFRCPVIDLYSTNECRLIAARTKEDFTVIPHDLYVEILDAEGHPVPRGERGEITITCNRNPFLPLLRYRTNDFAALHPRAAAPTLTGFEGRVPTLFLSADGGIVNNVDVSLILYAYPLAQYQLHQNADRSLVFKYNSDHISADQLRRSLLKVFGDKQSISFTPLSDADCPGGKTIQYTTDIKDIDISKQDFSYRQTSWQEILQEWQP